MFETLGLDGPRGRRLRLYALGGALGLLIILVANALSPGPATGPGAEPGPAGVEFAGQAAPAGSNRSLAAYEAELSARVAEVLSRIDGAGRVDAMVHLAAGEETVYLQDLERTTRETGERDTQGGTRSIEERTEAVRTVFAGDGRGGSQPVARLVNGARVEGVLVVAEGARDPEVRLRLLRAVQALFPDVPAHRIEILEGR